MRAFCCTLLLIVVAVPMSARPAASQESSAAEAIRQLRTESNAAIARQDVPGILASMEDEVLVAASGGTFIQGREAMGDAFASQFGQYQDALYVRTTEGVEVSESTTTASETGTWVGTWITDSGPFRTGGRYMAYWRLTSEGWRIHAEVYVPLFCEGSSCGG